MCRQRPTRPVPVIHNVHMRHYIWRKLSAARTVGSGEIQYTEFFAERQKMSALRTLLLPATKVCSRSERDVDLAKL